MPGTRKDFGQKYYSFVRPISAENRKTATKLTTKTIDPKQLFTENVSGRRVSVEGLNDDKVKNRVVKSKIYRSRGAS